jgi:rhodanese-related sulfurtransferase
MLRRMTAVALGLSLLLSCGVCSAKPSAVVQEPVFDFGVVLDGTVVEHIFLIDNDGDSDLAILDVQTSCGCTTANLSGSSVPPGDTIRLSASLATEGLAGSRVSRPITVRTNDPDRPEIILRLEGVVTAAQPYLVAAQDASAGLALVIDLRPLRDYELGHLVGAVSLAPDGAAEWMGHIPTSTPILLYDQSGEAAAAVAESLLRAGFLSVRVLLGGFDEWTRVYGNRLVVTFATVFIPLD